MPTVKLIKAFEVEAVEVKAITTDEIDLDSVQIMVNAWLVHPVTKQPLNQGIHPAIAAGDQNITEAERQTLKDAALIILKKNGLRA